MSEIPERIQRNLDEMIHTGQIQGIHVGVRQGRQEGQVAAPATTDRPEVRRRDGAPVVRTS